ncbi:phospholipid scramblase 2-like isoform X9 [Rhinichthys klamathensis goyatoka]|uniref:phospholipid scramblase 2-like isoform X9 n=1 Tax=Rhinichthys klamathensis goyatoka TaxID=3034132 RepID=UPI0024B4DDFB|nr:phospholipid scramblase 2-like isoform X9 [Rhinichthys klamathensis goyatoka]
MSEPGCPPQNDHPNPMPQPEGPATAPPAELQSVNQPAPVQLVMNLTDLSNPALHQVQPYTGPAPAPEPAGIQLVNQPASGQPVINPAPHHGQPYAAPPAELQPVNQLAPVQLVMNLTDLSNPAPHQVQPYAVNQPAPGQLVINLTDLSNPALHQVQPYTGPAPAPPAELQPVNQPAPVQLVINLTDLSNPALHQVQPYTGPAPAPPAELQPVNQPAPVQLVINPPGPSNPAPNQIQPYAAPAVPPLAIPFGVPPGLEYLIQIDQILIHQKVSFIEMLTGFETNNQYEIKNSIGQEIYHAKEESDCFTRNFFGSARSFQMHIKNNVGQEVIRMNRPMRCFLQEIEVQAPLGVTIGYVKQEWSWFLPKFSILGPNNEVLLEIHGPFLPIKCCGDINFEVKDMNGGKSIGRIIKQRSGFLKKCFTDATNFCIQFPLDMDVKMKTVLLGACFLIDILFFDKGGNLFLKVLKGS